MSKKQDQWTKEDQAKAAEKGQGAEVGAEHGSGEKPASSNAKGEADMSVDGTNAPEGVMPKKGKD